MARRLGEEGEVYLDVQVGPAGNVLEVRLKKSSGSSLLDQTAIETVKKWRFTPATVDGKPVAEWYYNWKWVFKLEG
jgi:protein TonB